MGKSNIILESLEPQYRDALMRFSKTYREFRDIDDAYHEIIAKESKIAIREWLTCMEVSGIISQSECRHLYFLLTN